VLVALLALAGAGCASDDDEASPTVATTAPTTTSGPPQLEGADTTPVEEPSQSSETALLTRVQIGSHESYDRVVFEFREHLPGYRVEYVDGPLSEDGSGNPVEIDGTAFLVVRMEPASGFDLSVPEGELVYTGPRRLSGADAGAATVREVVRTGDFEAVLTWAIGTNGVTPFKVSTLGSPSRLVIDFARPVE
jgi:hypothetical protein